MSSFTGVPGPVSAADDSTGDDADQGMSTTGDDEGEGETSVAEVSTSGDVDPSTTGDTAADGSGETGTPGPMEVTVQNHSASCSGVVWCTTADGQGSGPHAYAECFTNVVLDPPYKVTEIRYAIGRLEKTPSNARVEVRLFTGSAPGNVLGSQTLDGADLAVGLHAIPLQTPITVNASSFCIAVEGNDAFGVRRDESNPVPDRAFIRAESCDFFDYTSFSDISFPSNLCMSARISQ